MVQEPDEELAIQTMTYHKDTHEPFISGLSLQSIKYKKELEASLRKTDVNPEDLPQDDFTYDDLLKHWDYFAEEFHTTGRMLMASTMRMSAPIVENGNTIKVELPNEGSKNSFEENKYDIINGLRQKLNNYTLDIVIIVNEDIKIKKAFTIEDKFHHLRELNPVLDYLIKTFDLDLKM